MSFRQFDLEFTKRGEIHDPDQLEKILEEASDFTDLFVLSHGWNNDIQEAGSLYDALLQNMERVVGADVVPGIAGRDIDVVRIFWPSKRFADEDLIPGGGAATATVENSDVLLKLLEELKNDPERLGEVGTASTVEPSLTRAQKLVPRLQMDAAARREFVLQLRSILDPSEAHSDDGSDDFFSRDPEALFEDLDEPVIAPVAAGAGGATAVGPTGGAAGLGDRLKGIQAAARRLVNYTSYYRMKGRAGTVGRTGLGPMLQRLRDRNSSLRLHLVGHSFGARLVTAGAAALPNNTPAVTMTLLQGAFSHNGFAVKFDGVNNGFFRSVLSHKRVSGPVLITHTKNDTAVGIAHPLASRIARQKAAALGDQDDPYGGMGRNGAQHTPEAKGLAASMRNVGGDYSFAQGKVYNLLADEFIKDHGSVTGPEVAYALLSAAVSRLA